MSDFETVTCVHEGTTLNGYAARPEGTGLRPAVLMFPGATGPGPSFLAAIRELARDYVVIGIDMYGADADLSTPEAAGAYFTELLHVPSRLRDRVVAWYEAVRELPGVDPDRIAAVGYCFGGKCVLELARSGAPLRAAVSFHGLLQTHAPAEPGVVVAPVAVWTGGRDPFAPLSDLEGLCQEFDAAGVNYTTTVFAQAQHSFTDPDHHGVREGIAYDPMAHRIAWGGTKAMLDTSLHN